MFSARRGRQKGALNYGVLISLPHTTSSFLRMVCFALDGDWGRQQQGSQATGSRFFKSVKSPANVTSAD